MNIKRVYSGNVSNLFAVCCWSNCFLRLSLSLTIFNVWVGDNLKPERRRRRRRRRRFRAESDILSVQSPVPSKVLFFFLSSQPYIVSLSLCLYNEVRPPPPIINNYAKKKKKAFGACYDFSIENLPDSEECTGGESLPEVVGCLNSTFFFFLLFCLCGRCREVLQVRQKKKKKK